MLNLSAIKFQVDTSELEKVQKTIADIATDFSKLDRASQQAAKTAAQTEEILSRAAKNHAEARKSNAKAADQEIKTVIAVDKADVEREKTVRKVTEATEKASLASSKNVTILERQKDILEFQTQGWSKGQASILATAKASGLLTDELQELGKVLDTQRKLMGTDPFDKSLSGLKSLKNQYNELKESLRQYNSDSDLSSKQTRELARDKERLIEKMKVEGAGFREIRQAIRAYNQEYTGLAAQYNKLSSAEQQVVKNRKDIQSATNYLITADQKLAAALNTSNAAIDKSGTDLLVKYENALRKSGLAQDVVTQKLAAYRNQLAQVQLAEQKRAANNLSRALSPQITDVAVSLYSGQAPLTVLLQQGGQILDLFKLSGVAAEDFGKTMKAAFTSMIPAMATVAKGMASFIIGSFVDAGAAVANFVGKITGINAAMELAKRAIVSGGEENFKYIALLQRIGAVAAGVTAVGIAAAAAALVGLGVGLKQVIAEENELAKALALSGGSLAISHNEAIQYAKGMNEVGVTTGQAIDVIIQMAKAGNFTASEIAAVTKAAVDMQKYGGIAIEDTVKAFSKMKEKPVDALLDLAKTTGMIAPEVIKAVIELEKQGKIADAVAISMKALADVNSQQVSRMKEDYNSFSLFVIDLGKTIKNFFADTFKSLFYNESLSSALDSQLAEVQKKIKNVEGNQKTNAFFGITADPALLNSLKEQERMIIKQIDLMNVSTETKKRETEANAEAARVADATRKLMEQSEDAAEKAARKSMTLEQFRKDFVNDKLKDAAREKAIDIEKLKTNNELTKALEKQAEIEFKKMHKKDDKKAAQDLDTYADVLNKVNGLTSDYNNKLATLHSLRQKGKITEEQYVAAVEDLIKAQPFYIAQQKEINDAHELSNKLLGKADAFGKDYYTTLERIQKLQEKGIYSPEFADRLRQAAFSQTELAKEQLKYIVSSTKELQKFREESQKSLDATTVANGKLDARVELLGKTAEQQKYIRIEQEKNLALLEVEQKLTKQIAKIWEEVRQGKMDPFDAMSAQLEAERAAAEARKAINREVAVAYAEELDKAIRSIQEGISDSITTALFEGGQAGKKRLRDVLVAELRKPVTIMVNAVVNTLLGGVMNSFATSMFGGGGGLLGSISSLGGLASTANNLYSAITGGFANLSGSIATQVQSGINFLTGSGGMISQGPIQVGGLAQGIGSVAAPLLGAYGGISAGRLIGGGYSLNGGSGNSTINLGTAIGSLFGPLGGLAGGAIGGAVNRLFGRKLKDAGIEGTFGGDTGFEGNRFEYYKGGLFRSNKTVRTALDEETRSAFADQFQGIQDTIRPLAEALGMGTSLIDNFTTSISISLKGLSDSEAAAKIAEEFNKIAESMALATLGGSNYAKEGETSIQTLTRLATSLTTVNGMLNSLGKTAFATSTYGADLADQLVNLFGGVDSFSSATSAYFENYYSAEEKVSALRRQLTSELDKLGMKLPETKDGFRALVDAQDLNTEAGRKNFTVLMSLSGAFAQLVDSASEFLSLEQTIAAIRNPIRSVSDIAQNIVNLQDQVFELENKGNTEALRERQLRGLTDYEKALMRQIWAFEDLAAAQEKAQDKINTAQSDLISAYQDQANALQSSISRLRQYSTTLREFRDSMLLGGMSPLTPAEQYAEAKRQYEQTLAAAMVGDENAQNNLQNVINNFLQASRTYNASGDQYTNDFNAARTALEYIATITQDQANNEQIRLDATKSQLELLGVIDKSILSIGDRITTGLGALAEAIRAGIAIGLNVDPGAVQAVNTGLAPTIGGNNVVTAPATVSDNTDSANAQLLQALISEVQTLNSQVTTMRAEQQQDVQTQTQAIVAAQTSSAAVISDSVSQASYTQTVQQGAILN